MLDCAELAEPNILALRIKPAMNAGSGTLDDGTIAVQARLVPQVFRKVPLRKFSNLRQPIPSGLLPNPTIVIAPSADPERQNLQP